MEHAFEIYTESGTEITRHPCTEDSQTIQTVIVDGLSGEPWYRVRYHVCRNQERKPCDPWQVVSESGEVPDEE